MKPSGRSIGWSALVLVVASTAALWSAMPPISRAAGEPTVVITLDDTTLTEGETAMVTFVFSDVPDGFADDDIDLSDANGTLSPVAPSPDPHTWRATFTPTDDIRDTSNTISVGTAWTSTSTGSSPLEVAVSAPFSVLTAPGSGNACPPTPSVTVVIPNGGETFVPGSDVDVFWTMGGCQVVSLALLLLSSDGGTTYEVVATSDLPTSGYARWTVSDAPSGDVLLQARLLGPSGEVLASDATDGPFTIQSASWPPGGGAEAPAEPPASTGGGTATPPAPPTSTSTPVPTAEPTQPASPTSAPPPAAQTFPGPMAPPMPNIPQPLITTALTSPEETPMPPIEQDNQAPEATAAAVPSDGVRDAAEMASGYLPPSLDVVISFVLGAIMTLGAQQVMKRVKAKSLRSCVHCHGTGEEPKKGVGACSDCAGTGRVEEEEEQAMECKHCKGEGEDPCHRCKGSGKDVSGQECTACKGGGKTLTGKQNEDGEDEVAECEICNGEGEVSTTITKMVSCGRCGGTGKV